MQLRSPVLGTLAFLLTCALSPQASADSLPTLNIVAPSGDDNRADVSISRGPVRADSPKVGVKTDAASLNTLFVKIAAPLIYDEYSAYYLELRDFRSPELVVTLRLSGGEEQETRFALRAGEDLNEQISADAIFDEIDVEIVGQQDVFKCFDATTCILDSTYERTVYVRGDESLAVKNFDAILSCGGGEAVIERKIGDANTQRVVISNQSARNYIGIGEITEGYGDAADVGADFRGFSSTLASFQYGSAYRKAHVFTNTGGLTVKVDTAAHYFCHYMRTVSYPDYLTLATPIGYPCASPPDGDYRWHVTGSSGGSDQRYSRDWFFPGCQIVD